ncbi:MAG: CHASE3 domain-containing protein [Chloroflexi bacterium]|nr:CHASE3 domain-containing protein [Chloroflexota bacterium]
MVLTIMAVQSALAYRATVASQEAAARSERAQQVISNGYEVLATLISMETGYRGFLLTGQELFLAPYTEGLRVYPSMMGDLQAQSVTAPGQRLWRIAAERAADWVRNITEPGIALRRTINDKSLHEEDLFATVLERTAAGKNEFDALRAAFARAVAEERRQLDERNQEADQAASVLMNTLLWGTMAAAAMGLGVAIVIERNIGAAVVQVAAAVRQVAQHDLPALVQVVAGLAAGNSRGRVQVTAKPVPERGGDELAALARDTNQMIARLLEAGNEIEELALTVDGAMRRAASERDFMLATLEAAQDGILIADVAGNPLHANHRYHQWFGLTPCAG